MSSQPIHPLARAALGGLDLPDPEQREHILRTGTVADLASNTNPHGGELACYPPSHPVAIQERYASFLRHQLHASGVLTMAPRAEQVLFTCGSVEGISLLVAAFCEPFKDCICVCNPTFPFYARSALCNDIGVRHVMLLGTDLNRFDAGVISSHCPKLTFLCSPSNPVGTTLDPDCVIALLESACGLVVVDEAYIEFSKQPSALRWLTVASQLVVLRTFSKAWGLAGARIGAVIADPLILHTLRLVQLTYAFGTPAQQHVTKALSTPLHLKEDVERIQAQRDRLAGDLSRLSIVKRVYPSDTNFLLVAFYDAVAVYQTMLNAGILVADTRHQVADTLRISMGNEEHCERVVAVLRSL